MMETNKGMLVCPSSSAPSTEGGMQDVRRGPWTVEEDLVLVNYIENHGEGRWNSLARSSGLKRTGKSCRLRWLNYLRPDVRRGNITSEEQLLILELHSRWGNRWSKIVQYLPGRTDNEIKNYWRTRVQKHAKKLRCDVNSKKFTDVVRNLWMPRLLERIRAASSGISPAPPVCPGNSLPNPSPEEHFASKTASTWLSPTTVSDSFADCFSAPDSDTICADRIETTEINGNELSDIASPNYYYNPRLVDLDNGNLGGDVMGSLWNFEDIWL